MKRLELRFISEQSSFTMIMNSDHDIDYFASEFLSMFPSMNHEETDMGENRVTIEAFQRTSEKLRRNVAIYVEKYKAANPQVHKLRKFIENLTEDEYFFFAPNRDLTSQEILNITSIIAALNKGANPYTIRGEFEDLCGDAVANYEITVLDNSSRHQPIGEPDRSKRVCRFCGKSQPDVRFRNKAHAIPEALGNKHIILNEECDGCNDKFSETIERDIVNYLGLPRLFFGVQGKEGIPAIVGKEFKLKHVGKQKLDLAYSSRQDAAPNIFQFETWDTVEPQNIYRALCKFAMSIIGKEHLPSFSNTIKWINRETSYSRLPKVASLIIRGLSPSGPAIAVYTRRNNNRELPHMIGEFRFTCFTFVFIVPFSSEDDRSFDSDNAFDDLCKLFKYYDKAGKGKWKLNDFSGAERLRMSFNIVREQQHEREGVNP